MAHATDQILFVLGGAIGIAAVQYVFPIFAVAAINVDPTTAKHGAFPAGYGLLFLLLRGFAESCSAMTGTEAISNGVQAFRAPTQRNAAVTLSWMVAILATFFLGVSYMAHQYAVMPTTAETVLSQLGHHIFGGGIAYYALQYSTFAILVLAANTAFADFPRLAGILANDKFMPSQLAARGDRLAFSNGIISLALVAMLLVWLFNGDTNSLIPLYAIGVFVCFTLSQAGMVMHWCARRNRDGAGARRSTESAQSRRASCRSSRSSPSSPPAPGSSR